MMLVAPRHRQVVASAPKTQDWAVTAAALVQDSGKIS
jgi:hypothetical protein